MFLYGLTEMKKNLRCEDEDKKKIIEQQYRRHQLTHTHIWHMDINFVIAITSNDLGLAVYNEHRANVVTNIQVI